MASRICNEKARERARARRAANISDPQASEAEQFFTWRDENPNKSPSKYTAIQKALLADKAEEWNAVQLYILFLCFEESSCLAAAARKFSSFANRSEKSAYAKISSLTKQLSMSLQLLITLQYCSLLRLPFVCFDLWRYKTHNTLFKFLTLSSLYF